MHPLRAERVNSRLASLVLEYRVSVELRRAIRRWRGSRWRVRAFQSLACGMRCRSGVRSLGQGPGAILHGFRGAGYAGGIAWLARRGSAKRVSLHVLGSFFCSRSSCGPSPGRAVERSDRRAGVNWMLERPASAALALAIFASPWVYPTYSFALSATSGSSPSSRGFASSSPSPRNCRASVCLRAVLALDAVRPLLFPARIWSRCSSWLISCRACWSAGCGGRHAALPDE